MHIHVSLAPKDDHAQPGRGVEKKVPVELDKDGRPKRIALRSLKRADARSLTGFTTDHVAKSSCLRADGWGSYASVAKAGYEHDAIVTGGGKRAAETFPWGHTFIGNLKRMLLGTYHSVSPRHLERYLAAFVYQANCQWMEIWSNVVDRVMIRRRFS
jgi:ISXO2 transposase-like protein